MKLQNEIMDILKELKNFLSYILLFIILYIFIGIMISFASTLFQISLSSFGNFQVVFAPIIAGIITIWLWWRK
tara:strand:+ start:20782 stop:21000 length:219 start_codon:yes stop_codon:yes gene_type:complete